LGKLYQHTGKYLLGQFPDAVIVEIGSDRWEGSSAYFADLACHHHMKFVTVDLDEQAAHRVCRSMNPELFQKIEFVHAEGAEWSRRYQGSPIKVLYLDNFDWDWSISSHTDMIAQQKQWYQDRNITMTNLNCQAAHMMQMVNLFPHMCPQCLVCVDDTYQYNGVYIGKGGAVVPYLTGQGFNILMEQDYGIILGRGFKTNNVQ